MLRVYCMCIHLYVMLQPRESHHAAISTRLGHTLVKILTGAKVPMAQVVPTTALALFYLEASELGTRREACTYQVEESPAGDGEHLDTAHVEPSQTVWTLTLTNGGPTLVTLRRSERSRTLQASMGFSEL
jgi:hypothetical protein